jgi:hypothetical protein
MEENNTIKPEKIPKGFRTRKQRSGVTFYYFDFGKHRAEVPLGSDYGIALDQAKHLALGRYGAHRGCADAVLAGYKLAEPAHYLYRHFDEKGLLLYIGISFNPVSRLERHRKLSAWFHNIARIEVQRFETLEESEKAERSAIKAEFPLFNIRHAKPRARSYAKKLRTPGLI